MRYVNQISSSSAPITIDVDQNQRSLINIYTAIQPAFFKAYHQVVKLPFKFQKYGKSMYPDPQ